MIFVFDNTFFSRNILPKNTEFQNCGIACAHGKNWLNETGGKDWLNIICNKIPIIKKKLLL